MPSALRRLVCGNPEAMPPDLQPTFRHLAATLDFFVEHLRWVSHEPPERFSRLGPFMGRSILEISMTALVGRIDPFRLLTLKRVQEDDGYELGMRRKLAFQWRGDVIAEKSGGGDLWQDTDFAKIPRALLGAHYGEIVWEPAFKRLLDSDIEDDGSEWLGQIKRIEPERFVPRYRTEIDQVYSMLSKEIHHEFVIPSLTSDPATVTRRLNDVLRIVGTLGLVSSHIAHIQSAIPLEQAIALFRDLQDNEKL